MTDDERWLLALWMSARLMSHGVGPLAECDPTPVVVHQARHQAYWSVVSGIMPEDEDDEPHWMTSSASLELEHNN